MCRADARGGAPAPPEEIEIAARWAKATPGPWQVCREAAPLSALGADKGFNPANFSEVTIHTTWDHGQLHGPAPVVTVGISPYCEPQRRVHISDTDAEAIANAPNDIAWLLSALSAARARATDLEVTVRMMDEAGQRQHDRREAMVAAARRKALEEAANLLDRHGRYVAANHVRALAEPPTPQT